MVRSHPEHRYVLLVDEPSAPATRSTSPPGLEIVTVGVRHSPAGAAAAGASRGLIDMMRMTAAVRRLHCEAFFFPANYSYFPVVGPPIVVVVHDAIAEALPELTLPSFGDRTRWRAKQVGALHQAKAVITVSEASRRAILTAFRLAPERLHVIREAPAPAPAFGAQAAAGDAGALERHGLSPATPYFLYVGGISPHKNLLVLVEAFDAVAAGHPDVRLVLVGATVDDPFLSSTGSIRSAINRSPAAARISMPGFVPDGDLAALYRGAVATVQPSLAEGFGLTAAESAACGTPVVASRDPALVELLGGAGLYADATRPAEFAAYLDQLLDEPNRRAELVLAVSARASGWSWTAAADTTVDVIARVARRG